MTAESALPGHAAWARVRDYRDYQISQMGNVSVYRESRMGAAEVREFGAPNVVIATGARWRKDGIGRSNMFPIPGADSAGVLSAGEVLAGAAAEGPVVLYDDDGYYLGGALAEMLRGAGHAVTLVTPDTHASAWCDYTLEHSRIQARLLERDIAIVPNRILAAIDADGVEIACIYSGARERLACRTVVIAAGRLPDDELYHALVSDQAALTAAGIASVTRIGDCLAPSTIAAAVHGGHRYARELDGPAIADVPFRRERTAL